VNSFDWDRIEELFAGALACNPAERAAWLETECGGDLRVRAEVEALLTAYSQAEKSRFSIPTAPEIFFAQQSQGAVSLVGQKLDRFLVEKHLGAGGMGEVYQALDTRLGRKVALKVCARNFSDRFEREAQSIAALNHPNICTLHDVGPNYLVMELVDGPTLAERIGRGPIPEPEALAMACQIAEAVEAAHEKQIVHRDLKPANIKITSSGAIKVLDFGLAKAVPDSDGQLSANALATQSGVLLGTAAYMSPEQARGHAVDRRSDIWAFGVVLYEMLVGRPAFRGGSTEEVLAQVATAAPEMDPIPDLLRPVIARCLEKDPAKRWRSMVDVRYALEMQAAGRPAPMVKRRPPSWLFAAGAVFATLALVGLVWYSGYQPSRPLMQLSMDMGADAVPGSLLTAALSPDGTTLVFQSRTPDGKARLSVRKLAQTGSVALEGTEGSFAPFFSPDSKWIGFFAAGKMKKVPVEGGAPVELCDAIAPRGASWGTDGNIVAALRGRGGLSLIPAAGGAPQALTSPDGKDITHRWPQILPRGKAVIYTAHTNAAQYDDARIDALSLETGKKKTLITGAYFGRYTPSGHLLYIRKGILMAVPFDPSALEAKGVPVPLLDDVATDSSTAAAQFDFSRQGTFVYRSAKGPAAWSVDWLDSSGALQPLLPALGAYMNPKFSPDGTHLALSIYSGKGPEIYSLDVARGSMSRVTSSGQSSLGPVWTPDGKHIVFYYSMAGGYAIGWVRSDGAGEVHTLLRSRNFLVPYSFSPDGTRLAYYQQDPETNRDLWILPLNRADGDDPQPSQPQAFLKTPANEMNPVFSRDGRWILYASDESGSLDMYVRSFPGPGGPWRISSAGGEYGFWSPTGRELFFEAPDSRIMVVPFRAQAAAFVPDSPRLWTASRILNLPYSNLDLHPDGRRFAIFHVQDNSDSLHLSLLLNYFDEIKRRAPR
jgi:serine/threonine protein kinase